VLSKITEEGLEDFRDSYQNQINNQANEVNEEEMN